MKRNIIISGFVMFIFGLAALLLNGTCGMFQRDDAYFAPFPGTYCVYSLEITKVNPGDVLMRTAAPCDDLTVRTPELGYYSLLYFDRRAAPGWTPLKTAEPVKIVNQEVGIVGFVFAVVGLALFGILWLNPHLAAAGKRWLGSLILLAPLVSCASSSQAAATGFAYLELLESGKYPEAFLLLSESRQKSTPFILFMAAQQRAQALSGPIVRRSGFAAGHVRIFSSAEDWILRARLIGDKNDGYFEELRVSRSSSRSEFRITDHEYFEAPQDFETTMELSKPPELQSLIVQVQDAARRQLIALEESGSAVGGHFVFRFNNSIRPPLYERIASQLANCPRGWVQATVPAAIRSRFANCRDNAALLVGCFEHSPELFACIWTFDENKEYLPPISVIAADTERRTVYEFIEVDFRGQEFFLHGALLSRALPF